MTEKQWVNFMAPLAVKAMQRYGYRASVLIAQCCQETGYGQTDLAQDEIHNVLGMKEELLNDTWLSIYWHGETYSKKTPEWINGKKTYIKDYFRVYESYQDCFFDYCQFMQDAKLDNGKFKYRDLLNIKDPAELIQGVMQRGYCTDPEYAKSIMAIIRKWNLTQYDYEEAEEEEKMTLTQRLMQMGVALIDRIKQNFNCGQKHNANTHRYLAIHYLGVNGENPDLYDGCYGGHFYVSKNGTCYQAADVGDILWHVGASSKNGYRYIHEDARNQNTIGIECATFTASGHNDDDETWYYTTESQQAMAKLAAAIMMQYDIPMSNLLMHGNITTKICPAPYVRDGGKGSNWTWETFRAKVAEYLDQDQSADADATVIEVSILRKGNKGPAVKQLQSDLMELGYDLGKYKADGRYGDDTEAAVVAFQLDKHLKADGIAGPITLEAVQNALDELIAAQAEEQEKETEREDDKKIMYYVQCGAFGVKENANKKVMALSGKGFVAIVKDYGQQAAAGTRYRVQVGAFINKDRAEAMILDLKTEGIEALIKTE